MTYKSDGKGNMAHSAVIICYDGKTRIPKVAKRYDNVTGVLPK
jgi:branched-chain amino acid transport system substrate-binding protein